MSVNQWPGVVLKGGSQVIPRLCPNCMKPATTDLRYAYANPWAVLGSRQYFQTFRYCDACAPAAEALAGHRRKTAWMYRFPGIFALLIPPLAVVIPLLVLARNLQVMPQDPNVVTGLAIAGLVLLGLFPAWILERWFLGRLQRRHPQSAAQACWGLAAYYTGDTLLGVQSRKYQAARPEWIRALVQANADQVSDEVYRQATGEARPAPSGQRPFAR
jgi:hypothetical protein